MALTQQNQNCKIEVATNIWVIGSQGLLGSSVCVELLKNNSVWRPSQRIIWTSTNDVDSIALMEKSIDACVLEFSKMRTEQSWNIYWCAGVGVVKSSKELLEIEVRAIRFLLTSLTKYGLTSCKNSKIFFASSAGGVYAGSINPPFNEMSIPVPISNYGKQKIEIEELLADFGEKYGVEIILGRIANLYGPKQNRLKQQGLLTTLVQHAISNTAARLYVPLSTIRNYIYADDAAFQIVSYVRNSENTKRTVVICSENNWSLSNILRMTQDVTKKRMLYFQSTTEVTALQPIDLRLATEQAFPSQRYLETPRAVGINNIRLHLLQSL